MKYILTLMLLSYGLICFAEAGVIVPRGHSTPDNKILTTETMRVDVNIVNLHATVKIMQIFHNKTNFRQEGEYIFTLPDDAMISNFAIWEDGKRIKGVIMEKRKARALYEKITARLVDPGLLEKKEDSLNQFTVHIYPIPANGYKRIEIEYTELLPVYFLKNLYRFPLKPLLYKKFKTEIGRFFFNFSIKNSIPFTANKFSAPFPVTFSQKVNGLTILKNKPTHRSFQYSGKQITLDTDFAVTLKFPIKESMLNLLTFRDINTTRIDYSPANHGKKYQDKTGFFMAQLFLNASKKTDQKNSKKVVIVFDHSLSMKWHKLNTAYRILTDGILAHLTPQDQFDMVYWNNEAKSLFNGKLTPATEKNRKLAATKTGALTVLNGTDVTKLIKALKKYPQGTQIYWITDGQPTLGNLNGKNLLQEMQSSLKHLKFFLFAVGNKSNRKLLSGLARSSDGFYLHFFENEAIEGKLSLFRDAINQTPLKNVITHLKSESNFEQVYALNQNNTIYNHATYTLVGKYLKPVKSTLALSFLNQNEQEEKKFSLTLPKKETQYPFIKRLWAKARIDIIMGIINEKGETKALINEIIALSKEFTLVTPYTSFLAAPRSLLRPRSIIPGDPVLRVKADKNIKTVTVKFSFGPVKKLNYHPERKLWETRFLVPAHLKDGEYIVKLFLEDDHGRVFIEDKSLLIDATPPTMTVHYEASENHVKLIARASQDTRKIFGYYQDQVIPLRYDPKAGASIGYLKQSLYKQNQPIKFILEDFAHNTTTITDTIRFQGAK